MLIVITCPQRFLDKGCDSMNSHSFNSKPLNPARNCCSEQSNRPQGSD